MRLRCTLSRLLLACSLAACFNLGAAAADPAARRDVRPATVTTHPAHPGISDAARQFAMQVLNSRDHGGRPFAIVDKHAALMVVYRADGTLAGSTGVLLGRVRGDHSQPGVGERTQAGRLRPEDATTPAGRFSSQPGINRSGEAVVWVEPETAFAIHRLRNDASAASRKRALASSRLQDRRASAGCVVVPVAFYEAVVQPLLGARRAVVYVMPERSHWQSMWDGSGTAGL